MPLVPIKRLYLNSGNEHEILLNTDYIMKIIPTQEPDKPKTRIVFDSGTSEGPDLIYTDESYSIIKARVTRQRQK